MTTGLVNNTSSTHTVRIEVWRDGNPNPVFTDDYVGAPGAWWNGKVAPVSIYANERFIYKLDGVKIIDIRAEVIWYLANCEVAYGPNQTIRTAIAHGLRNLDTHYVGGGSPYRFGAPGNGGYYRMSGQSWYVSPLGAVGFDCSGLIWAMYKAAGVDIGAKSSASMYYFPAVSPANLRSGDLIVKPGSHVVMYVGDGNGDGVPSIIEASPYQKVIVGYRDGSPVYKAWGVRLAPATKYLNADKSPKAGWYLRRVPGV